MVIFHRVDYFKSWLLKIIDTVQSACTVENVFYFSISVFIFNFSFLLICCILSNLKNKMI